MPTATKHPITRDPGPHSGAPVFTGTRIAVKIQPTTWPTASDRGLREAVSSVSREQAVAD